MIILIATFLEILINGNNCQLVDQANNLICSIFILVGQDE